LTRSDAIVTLDKGDNYDVWEDNNGLDIVEDFVDEDVTAVLDLNGEVMLVTGAAKATSGDLYGIVTYAKDGRYVTLTVFNKDGKEVDYTAESSREFRGLVGLGYYATGNNVEYAALKYKLTSDSEIAKEKSVVAKIKGHNCIAAYPANDEATDLLSKEVFKGNLTKGSDKKNITVDGKTFYIASDTVIMQALNTDGKLDPSLITVDKFVSLSIEKENNNNEAVVFGENGKDAKFIVMLNKNFKGAEEDLYYGVVTDKPYKSGGSYYATINVFGEGEKDYKIDDAADFPKAKVVCFKFNNKGEATIYKDAVTNKEYTYDDGYVTIGSDTYKVDSSAILYSLDGSDIDKKISRTALKDYKYINYVLDDSNVIVAATVSEKKTTGLTPTPTTGAITYISATGFTVDNKTAYFTTDRTILRDKNGNILLTGKDLTSKLRVGDQVDVTATGTDVDEVKIVKTKAELELEAAVKAANKALEDHIAAGGKAANTEYIALQNALEADPKVKADIEAATNSLKALTDAINAAKAAQAAYLAAGGSATDAVYKAVSTALAADPQVKTDIETATTALQSATTGMSKQAIVNAELAKIPATLVLAGDTSFANDTTGRANIKAAVEGLVDNNKVIVSTPTFTNPTWKVELTLRADGTIKADKEITVTNEKTVAEKAKVNAELAKVVDFTLPAGSACDINAIEAAVTAKVDLNKVEVTSVTAGTGTNKFDVTLTAKGGAYSDTKTITVSSADVNAAKALVPTTIASITVAGGNSATDAAKETAVKTYIEGLEGMTATGVTVTVTSGTTYEVVLTKNSISAKVTVTVTEFVAP